MFPFLFLQSVVFCALLSGQHSHILDKNSTGIDCANICAATEGQAKSDAETTLCKCLPSKHLDDVELALLNKNAILTRKTDNTRHHHEKTISKREAEVSPIPPVPIVNQELDETPEIAAPEAIVAAAAPISEDDPNPEAIVGQAAPNRRPNQRGGPQRRQRDPRPISLDQQKLISQQINDHLTRLSQHSDQRLRDAEIQAIRGNLRQLSNTVLMLPQPRSRMRAFVEETKSKRPARPRLIHSRIVGAASPNAEEQDDFKEEADKKVRESLLGKRKHEIITQDPTLVDE